MVTGNFLRLTNALLFTTFGSYAFAATTTEISTSKRLEQLEQQLNELRAQTEKTTLPTQLETKSGFNFKFGGRVKIDAFYDINARGDVFGLDPATLPLRGIDPSDNNKGHFKFSPMATRLYTEAQQTFGNIPTRGYVEIDFGRSLVYSSSSFIPRIRHAYIEIGNLLIGQTWYNFQDLGAFANTLDNLYGGSRHNMVRYTHKFTPCLSLALAAEDPNTDYFDSFNNARNENAQIGKSRVPDLSAQLRFKHNQGHIAFSAVGRQLEVNGELGGVTIRDKQYGWGLGFTGRYNFYGKSGFLWQVNGGKGIGRYIDDLSQAVYVENQPSPIFSTIRALNYIAAVEIWLTDKLAVTIDTSITRISKPHNFVSDSTNYNRHQDRYHASFIYKIFPNSDVGLEVMHYKRRAGIITDNKGKDTRILGSFIYNFNL